MRFESLRSSRRGRAAGRGRAGPGRAAGLALAAFAFGALAAAGNAAARTALDPTAPAEARALQSPDSVEAAVRRLLEAQEDAWNAGDLAGFMRGYWDSPELVFTSGGSVHRGFADLARRYRETYGTGAEMGRLSFADLEVHALGDSAAWVLGTWALEHGGERLGGVFTLVLRRLDDGWRIVHDHTSSGAPPREGEP